jgi:heme exporter protein A
MPLFAGHDLTCLRGERLVFAGLAFGLAAGEALVLTGPNGSGKSSLLRLMATLLRPWSGEMTWDGVPVREAADDHRARLRYAGHQDGIKPVLSALENLAFWAGLDRRPDPFARARAALERLGLSRQAGTPGRYLSAGQKRRLNLARLLLGPAPLWLLDEPANGLDRASLTLLEAEIARHRAGGGMVVLATHTDLDLPGARTLRLDAFTPQAADEDDGSGDEGGDDEGSDDGGGRGEARP